MDSDPWSNLCRSCLSPNSEVSLLDAELDVKTKFVEVTTVEVADDDGLPQKLCGECYSKMNSAFEFRKQCIKMNTELKIQQETLIRQNKEYETTKMVSHNDDTANVMTELLSIIKQEPTDSDDDCYYVLVIDDPKDSEQEVQKVVKEEHIKQECDNSVDLTLQHDESEDSATRKVLEQKYDTYIDTTKVPANVPATILENEESPDIEEDNDVMDIDDTYMEDSVSQEQHLTQNEDSEEQNLELEISGNIDELPNKKNFFKIITTNGKDGTIVFNGDDGIQYLTESQLVTHKDDDGNLINQEEVIFCEGEDSAQFQVLKCDDSELIIEYAGEEGDQIATVLQQEDGTYICDCGVEFEDLTLYEKHQHQHNPAGDHLCNLCGKGFESAEILSGHMVLHTVTGTLVTCPFCKQLIRRNGLTQHIKFSHNNLKPQCSSCSKTFANTNNLKRHMMIHSGVRDFECDICFKRFSQKITMQTHRLTHIDPFACIECDETFENQAGLMDHKSGDACTKSKVKRVKQELMKTVKQEVTTNLGKLLGYACSLCKKMFSVESALELHIEGHHMIDPSDLLCSECGEVLPSKKDMQAHIASHKTLKFRSIKRFQCGSCGKACASQAMLMMHERVHTNERPYPCGLCTLKFKTKTHLRTHQLTHTREKKFGCSVCMKFFALKGNLVVHLRTHTGERPYVCSICSEAFIDSKYLKKHKLKKHYIDNVPWNQY